MKPDEYGITEIILFVGSQLSKPSKYGLYTRKYSSLIVLDRMAG